MMKYFCAVLLFLTNLGNIFVKGQNTVGGCINGEHEIADGLSGFLNDLNGYYRDTKSIQSEFQNLEAQIVRLENSVESHNTYMFYSLPEIRRKIEMENTETKTELYAQHQKLQGEATLAMNKSIQSAYQSLEAQIVRLENRVEGHDTYMNYSLQESRRHVEMENVEMKTELHGQFQKLQGDVEFAMNKSIQSEVQSLKAQLVRLENRVQLHDNVITSSLQQIKSLIQTENMRLPRSHCPTGFTYNAIGSPKCYAYLSEKADWDTAQQKCRQLHGDAHLAVITNDFEQQIIIKILRNKYCQGTIINDRGESISWEHYWLGGQLKNINDCSSTFVWKPYHWTEMPITYRNWFAGEPNCYGNEENSLSIQKNGLWYDASSRWSLCSICEVIAQA